MAKKNKNYWIERSDKRMEVAHRNANEVTSEVARAYDKAIENICADMENILTNFSKLEGMDKAEALKLLNERISQKRLDEIRAKIATMEDGPIKTQLINKINAQAYKARLTRLQALKENLQVECAQIAQTELAANNKFFVKQAKDTYYRNMFDFSKGIGYAIDFATVPTKRINEILSTNWSGKHYSSRIWENNQVFADKLEEIILHGAMNGYNSRKMAKELQEYANVGKHVSERLLRTETTYIATMSDLEAMKERNTKQLQFVATLDSRTSPQCQKADGKLIDVDKAKPGVNVPPLHPYCRSTVIEVMDDLQHNVRIARDEDGKPIQVPAGMTYPEWKKKYVKNNVEKNGNSDIIKDIKDSGIKGEINIPPKIVDTSKLTYDNNHINVERSHNITKEQAISYINNAELSLSKWNGRFENYYSKKGAAFVDVDNNKIRTAFSREQYDENSKRIIEVIEKYGK